MIRVGSDLSGRTADLEASIKYVNNQIRYIE